MKAWVFPVLMIMMVAQASAALVTTGSSLDATLLYYEPVPAQPGDLLDVRILVTNSGGRASKGGEIRFVNSFPFSVENSGEKTQSFPSIPAQESFLLRTNVRVDKAASEGTNILTVMLSEGDSASSLEKKFEISIQGRAGALSVTEVKTEPPIIPPGSTGEMLITVRNVGDTRLRNVNVELDLTGLSLAPFGGSASQTIDVLNGRASHTFKFGLTAFPGAETNAYQLPIMIDYDDERGNDATQNKTVGIVIGAAPELLVMFDQVNVVETSGQGEVIIRFVNKGLNEIKLLEATIVESDNVEVLSESNTVYVGNIDEDDYETADFMLKVSGETEVPLRIQYRDALNQQYDETVMLNLVPKKGENGGGFSWPTIIVVLLIIGGIIWWWRGRKKRGRK